MDSSERQRILDDADRFLEQMRARDREHAHKKLVADPTSLTAHERKLLNLDYLPRPTPVKMTPPPPSPRERAAAALTPAGIVWRTPFLRRLNEHAIALVVEHGLTVQRSPAVSGWASAERRHICVRP